MPPLNIIPLNKARLLPVNYFIDANVWFLALLDFDGLKLQRWEKEYVDFFYDIVDNTKESGPKILLSTVLLSEIVNTYLRKIAVEDYEHTTGNKVADYKRDYKGTQHYKDSFTILMDNIKGVSGAIRFIDDRTLINNPAVLLQRDIAALDYNDHLYHHLCLELQKHERVVFVTCDGDFVMNDIELITANKKLLGNR